MENFYTRKDTPENVFLPTHPFPLRSKGDIPNLDSALAKFLPRFVSGWAYMVLCAPPRLDV